LIQKFFEKKKTNFLFKTFPKSEDQLGTTIGKTVPIIEPHYQLPSSEPVPPTTKDTTSIFSQVNIDVFRERTFPKGSEVK
jgi:hypothetical protein